MRTRFDVLRTIRRVVFGGGTAGRAAGARVRSRARCVVAAASLFFIALDAGCATPSPPSSAPFSVSMTPGTLAYAFAGQPIVFLVDLTGDDAAETVRVEATAIGAAVGVEPRDARPGSVVEVTVVPDATQAFRNLTLTVTATRGSERHDASLTFEVADPMTPPLEHAATVRDAFVAWFAQEHPELNITAGQVWVGAFARPNILVVSYYVFYSPKWEMGVRWHVMIPPYDWVEVYLRPRFVATDPTMQFKVDSFTAETFRPYSVTPEPVWR